MSLTKLELQDVYALLGALMPPERRLSVAEVVRVGDLRGRIQVTLNAMRPVEEKGDLVLEWRIPRELAAIKSGKGLKMWQLGQLKTKLGDDLRNNVLRRHPGADLCGAQKRRWVQVRRFSNKKPDRPTCADCLGARQAIDLLKDAGIIIDDSPQWVVDDTDWIACKQGATHVVIRVFEVATEGRHWPEPDCLPPPKPVAKRGKIVQSIAEGGA